MYACRTSRMNSVTHRFAFARALRPAHAAAQLPVMLEIKLILVQVLSMAAVVASRKYSVIGRAARCDATRCDVGRSMAGLALSGPLASSDAVEQQCSSLLHPSTVP